MPPIHIMLTLNYHVHQHLCTSNNSSIDSIRPYLPEQWLESSMEVVQEKV